MSNHGGAANKKVTVIDYGLGNLHSVANALSYIGASVTVSSDPRQIGDADRLVLPGVGAFADGMRHLDGRALMASITEHVERGRPLLGICLGMQLLFGESEEYGHHRGLGLIPGRVVGIPASPEVKVPHVGWNRIHQPRACAWEGSLLAATPERTMVYFVHSFAGVVTDEAHLLAETFVGPHRITAAVRKDAVVGCQFHPEKSGPLGLSMLERFLEA